MGAQRCVSVKGFYSLRTNLKVGSVHPTCPLPSGWSSFARSRIHLFTREIRECPRQTGRPGRPTGGNLPGEGGKRVRHPTMKTRRRHSLSPAVPSQVPVGLGPPSPPPSPQQPRSLRGRASPNSRTEPPRGCGAPNSPTVILSLELRPESFQNLRPAHFLFTRPFFRASFGYCVHTERRASAGLAAASLFKSGSRSQPPPRRTLLFLRLCVLTPRGTTRGRGHLPPRSICRAGRQARVARDPEMRGAAGRAALPGGVPVCNAGTAQGRAPHVWGSRAGHPRRHRPHGPATGGPC